LPEYIKEAPHITLGRINGKVYYFSRIGSLFDVADFFGAASLGKDVMEILSGKTTYWQKMKQLATNPANVVLGGTIGHAGGEILDSMSPILQTLLALRNGVKPGIEEGVAPIRDSMEFLFSSFGFGDEYRALSALPKRKTGDYWFGLVGIRKAVADEQTYYKAISRKNEYLKQLGRDTQTISTGEYAETAYYFKLAMRMGDEEAALKYLTRYIMLGGSKATMKQSLASLDPMFGLNEESQKAYRKLLTTKEREELAQAIVYYEKLLAESVSFMNNKWYKAGGTSGGD
jgi:tetratricopeptide (TPR) repeat protein